MNSGQSVIAHISVAVGTATERAKGGNMTKKEPLKKIIHGVDIMHIDGHDSWLTCTLKDGEKLTISFTMLFKLFDNYNIEANRFGEGSDNPRWRTSKFIQHSEDK